MKFRDIEVDEVKILEANTTLELEKQIIALGAYYIVVDLQYSTRIEWNQPNNPYYYQDNQGQPILYPYTVWSVLALLRKK